MAGSSSNFSEQFSEDKLTSEGLFDVTVLKDEKDFSEVESTVSSDLDFGFLYVSSESEGSYEPEHDAFDSTMLLDPHRNFPPQIPEQDTVVIDEDMFLDPQCDSPPQIPEQDTAAVIDEGMFLDPQCDSPPQIPEQDTVVSEEDESGEEEQHIVSVNRNLWASVRKEERKDVKSKFTELNVGPKESPANHEPIEYFNLFMSDSLINIIVRETNSYAKLCSEVSRKTNKLQPRSRLQSWHGVTCSEIRKFLAITLNMGLTQRRTLADYWSQDPLELLPWYGQTMSFNRFQAIHTMLNLTSKSTVPKDEPGHDPWVKILPFLNAANSAFKRYYVPAQDLWMDEDVIRMKNQCSFVQNTPDKHRARFRFKRFDLVDSKTNYVVHTELLSREEYSGNLSSEFTDKFVFNLVKKSGCLGKGHHIFADSYYITVELAQMLLNKDTFLTGTIGEEDLPGTVRKTHLGVQKSIYSRNGSVLVVGYREIPTKKAAFYISTAYHAENYNVRNRSGCVVHRPHLVDQYNKIKSERECANKSVYYLSCTRAVRCAWRLMFFSLLDTCVLNAYILYALKCKPHPPLSRKDFILSLCRSLAQDSAVQSQDLARQVKELHSEIERLMTKSQYDTSRVQNEVSSLTEQLSLKRAESEKLNSLVQTLQAENNRLNHQISSACVEAKQLRDENESLAAQVTASMERPATEGRENGDVTYTENKHLDNNSEKIHENILLIEQLKDDIVSKDKEINRFKTDLTQQESLINSLKNEIDITHSNGEKMLKEISSYKSLVEEQESVINALREEGDSAHKLVVSLREDINKNKAELIRLSKDYPTREQLESRENTIEKLTSELNTHKTKLADQAALIQALQKEIDKHKASVEDSNKKEILLNELCAYKTELAEKEAVIESFILQINNYKTEVKQLTDELTCSKHSVNKLSKEVKDYKNKEANLNEELKIQKLKNDEAGETARLEEQERTKMLLQRILPHISINNSQDYEAWLEQFMSCARESVSGGDSTSESHVTMLAEVEQQNCQLQAMVTHYKAIIADTEGMLNRLQSHVEQEEGRWGQQIQTLESQLEAVIQERDRLEENSELAAQLEAALTKNKELGKELTRLQSLLVIGEKSFNDQFKETQQLKEQVEALQAGVKNGLSTADGGFDAN